MALTSCDEARQYPRYFLRGPEEKALLRCLPTLAGLHRPGEVWPVYTVTVSRGGVGVLHFEQLFPGERAQFVLAAGPKRIVEVSWCRRFGPKCFEIGARFLEKLPTDELRRLVA